MAKPGPKRTIPGTTLFDGEQARNHQSPDGQVKRRQQSVRLNVQAVADAEQPDADNAVGDDDCQQKEPEVPRDVLPAACRQPPPGIAAFPSDQERPCPYERPKIGDTQEVERMRIDQGVRRPAADRPIGGGAQRRELPLLAASKPATHRADETDQNEQANIVECRNRHKGHAVHHSRRSRRGNHC